VCVSGGERGRGERDRSLGRKFTGTRTPTYGRRCRIIRTGRINVSTCISHSYTNVCIYMYLHAYHIYTQTYVSTCIHMHITYIHKRMADVAALYAQVVLLCLCAHLNIYQLTYGRGSYVHQKYLIGQNKIFFILPYQICFILPYQKYFILPYQICFILPYQIFFILPLSNIFYSALSNIVLYLPAHQMYFCIYMHIKYIPTYLWQRWPRCTHRWYVFTSNIFCSALSNMHICTSNIFLYLSNIFTCASNILLYLYVHQVYFSIYMHIVQQTLLRCALRLPKKGHIYVCK
jgi:hypothetical protein